MLLFSFASAMSTRYQSHHAQHHQALTTPTVASPVSQSRASRLSQAAAALQRNGPRWPSTRLAAMDQDQDVIQSFFQPGTMTVIVSTTSRTFHRPRSCNKCAENMLFACIACASAARLYTLDWGDMLHRGWEINRVLLLYD